MTAQIIAAFLGGATVPALLGWLRARRGDPQLTVRSADGHPGEWHHLEPGARVLITVHGTWTWSRDNRIKAGRRWS